MFELLFLRSLCNWRKNNPSLFFFSHLSLNSLKILFLYLFLSLFVSFLNRSNSSWTQSRSFSNCSHHFQIILLSPLFKHRRAFNLFNFKDLHLSSFSFIFHFFKELSNMSDVIIIIKSFLQKYLLRLTCSHRSIWLSRRRLSANIRAWIWYFWKVSLNLSWTHVGTVSAYSCRLEMGSCGRLARKDDFNNCWLLFDNFYGRRSLMFLFFKFGWLKNFLLRS